MPLARVAEGPFFLSRRNYDPLLLVVGPFLFLFLRLTNLLSHEEAEVSFSLALGFAVLSGGGGWNSKEGLSLARRGRNTALSSPGRSIAVPSPVGRSALLPLMRPRR